MDSGRLADPARQAQFNLRLNFSVRPMFAGRVIEITEDTMLRWRFLFAAGRKAGRTVSSPDLLIAATALEHNLTLATRNVKDFAGLEVPLLNPWENQA